MVHVGARIKRLIEAKGEINKAEFARKIGHTEQSLYRILNKEDISTALLKTICEALNISVSEFFAETNKAKLDGIKGGTTNIHLELDSNDILKIDLKNKRLEILKK